MPAMLFCRHGKSIAPKGRSYSEGQRLIQKQL